MLALSAALLAITSSGNDSPPIPAGTHLEIKLATKVSSKSNQVGDLFSGELQHSVVSSTGAEIVPAGSTVQGHVILVERATRSRSGTLKLCIDSVTTPGGTVYKIPAEAQRLTDMVPQQEGAQAESPTEREDSVSPPAAPREMIFSQVWVVPKDAILKPGAILIFLLTQDVAGSRAPGK